MSAKAIKGITLVLLLTMSGSAWALGVPDGSIIDVTPEPDNKAESDEETGSVNNTIKKGIDNISIGADDLGNLGGLPDKVLKQFVGGSLTFLAKNLLGDIKINVFGKKDSDQKSSAILTAGNTLVSPEVYNSLTSAITKSLEKPFDSDLSNNVINVGEKASAEVQKIIIGGIKKRVTQENAVRGNLDTESSEIQSTALGFAAQSVVKSDNKSAEMSYNTALKTSQAYKLADLATDKNAVAANTANTKRMQSAVTKLTTETNNAVSTRATIQSLNYAVTAMMKQELFGNERLQDRLNLMLLQGARTNDQLGDMVTALRAEDAQKTREYTERVNRAQAEANRNIDSFKNAASTATQTLKNGTSSEEIIGDSVTFGTIKAPEGSFKVPESNGTEFDGTGNITVGGEVPPGTEGVSTDGTTGEPKVEIPVPAPKAPTPTAGKMGQNPVSEPATPSNKNEVSGNQAKDLLGKIADGIEADIVPFSAEYRATKKYKDAKRAYYTAVARKGCLIRDPSNKNCSQIDIPIPPLTEKEEEQLGVPNPDRINVINALW